MSATIGSMTEYIMAEAAPDINVYLINEPVSRLPQARQGPTYTHMHAVARPFRAGDQLRGSSASFDGAGTNTMSCAPFSAACFATRVPSRSTRWTVPGISSILDGSRGSIRDIARDKDGTAVCGSREDETCGC